MAIVKNVKTAMLTAGLVASLFSAPVQAQQRAVPRQNVHTRTPAPSGRAVPRVTRPIAQQTARQNIYYNVPQRNGGFYFFLQYASPVFCPFVYPANPWLYLDPLNRRFDIQYAQAMNTAYPYYSMPVTVNGPPYPGRTDFFEAGQQDDKEREIAELRAEVAALRNQMNERLLSGGEIDPKWDCAKKWAETVSSLENEVYQKYGERTGMLYHASVEANAANKPVVRVRIGGETLGSYDFENWNRERIMVPVYLKQHVDREIYGTAKTTGDTNLYEFAKPQINDMTIPQTSCSGPSGS